MSFKKNVLALLRRQPGDVLDDDGYEEVHDQEVPEEDEDEQAEEVDLGARSAPAGPPGADKPGLRFLSNLKNFGKTLLVFGCIGTDFCKKKYTSASRKRVTHKGKRSLRDKILKCCSKIQ